MNAKTKDKARFAARRFSDKWYKSYPDIVRGLANTLDDPIVLYTFKDEKWQR